MFIQREIAINDFRWSSKAGIGFVLRLGGIVSNYAHSILHLRTRCESIGIRLGSALCFEVEEVNLMGGIICELHSLVRKGRPGLIQPPNLARETTANGLGNCSGKSGAEDTPKHKEMHWEIKSSRGRVLFCSLARKRAIIGEGKRRLRQTRIYSPEPRGVIWR